MSIQRILVALDRSDRADRVFQQGLELATALQSQVKLLHCLQHPRVPATANPMNRGLATNPGFGAVTASTTAMPYTVPTGAPGNPQVWQELQDAATEWLTQLQQRAAAQLGDRAVAMECRMASPEDGICAVAADWDADLVVLGRRGHTGLEEALMGSVSNHVLHHASCTVMAVQHSDTN